MADTEVYDEQPRQFQQPYTSKHPVPTIASYEEEVRCRPGSSRKSSPTRIATGHIKDEQRETNDTVAKDIQGGSFPSKRYGPNLEADGNVATHDEAAESHSQAKREHRSEGVYTDYDSCSEWGIHTPTASTHSYGRTPPSEQEGQTMYGPEGIGYEEKGKSPQSPINSAEAARSQQEPLEEPPRIPRHDAKGEIKGGYNKDSEKNTRTVTDPITHLPVTIHDNTSTELSELPITSNITGSWDAGDQRCNRNDEKHFYLSKLVEKEIMDDELEEQTRRSSVRLSIEIGLLVFSLALMWGFIRKSGKSKTWWDFLPKSSKGKMWDDIPWDFLHNIVGAALLGLSAGWWVGRKAPNSQKHSKDSSQIQGESNSNGPNDAFKPETTLWLNNILASIWPLINPSLFVSLFDTLEDVMQASLQNATRLPIEGVSVSDWGQGSEPMNILGVRWLDPGLAAQDTNGMEAEEGEFVNLELAVSYRARESGRKFAQKVKNAHVFIEFWWKGGFKLPIWVEVHSFIGTARVRLQLSPDPPFFSVCTLTLLGQPKVSISCVPLTRKFFNIMDIPIASGFVQNSINAAMAQYVAPRSLRLNLKQMIVGDDFKKDTSARGALIITVGGARGFKDGDGSKKWLLGEKLKEKLYERNNNKKSDNNKDEAAEGPGGGDAYVAVGWAKFGKPIFKTRIITDCEAPNWEETTAILVGPEELNAGERLRLQLWDSDRTSVDDLLGSVEADLYDLMHNSATLGKICSRVDQLSDMGSHKPMPGELRWSVGYFEKTTLTEEQLGIKGQDGQSSGSHLHQDEDKVEERADAIREEIERKAKAKLREAPEGSPLLAREIEQQKHEDLKEQVDNMMAMSPPDPDYPSGILSIQIHHGIGFEIEKQRNPDRGFIKMEPSGGGEGLDGNDEDREEGDDLPSTYCEIVLNHVKIYKTRVKWKTPKPFFNAGMERFIRDWKNTEIIIAVRDARMHENDALLGVVVLPLKEMFKDKSQLNGVFPLCGGIGYGRIRISMLFRGVQAQLPHTLLGWNIGTLEIQKQVTASEDIPSELHLTKLVLRTASGKGKMFPASKEDIKSIKENNGNLCMWKRKRDRNLFLPVKRRYSTYLFIEFHQTHHSLATLFDGHSVTAFCVLWLKEIPDANDGIWLDLKLPIWSVREEGRGGTKDTLSNATQSCEESYGEEIGLLNVKLRFHPGLSGYHGKLADKDKGFGDVMEILDCAAEAREVGTDLEGGQYGSDTSSSESDSDTDDEKEGNKLRSSGERGLVDDLKEYKMNKTQLHRHHRGLMQWKGGRTLKWMKDEAKLKGDHLIEKIERKILHSQDGEGYGDNEMEGGIETEV